MISLQEDVGTRTYRYIAAQGPMENTAADFWQMVWEQNITIIVAATDDKVGHIFYLLTSVLCSVTLFMVSDLMLSLFREERVSKGFIHGT